MDMDKKLQDAINEQIKNELYSAYMYLSMATYFDYENMRGFAAWMKAQAKEEYAHAMKLYGHLADRGARVSLKAIEQPPVNFNSPLEVFEQTLAHEKKVTKMIEALYILASDLKDTAASIMLQWFVTEQVEEESTASGIVGTLKMLKDESQSIFMFDRELGKRE
jgi:ferritin